ncbi:MAG: hypothetical protein CMJ76_14845 [Planctomycetaceae bacterium]|nr:hypothetical protein [Planctomycetaceae bacterium]
MFPFLAVLICTMGALIAVLVVGVQQARVDAAQDSQTISQGHQRIVALNEKRELEIESYQWRSEVLESKRGEYHDQIRQNRLRLAQLETHIRDLEERWQALINKSRLVAEKRVDSNDSQIDLEDELTRLQQEILTARTELEQIRVEAQQYEKSYAIVPYQGEYGTHRRPVYLECVAEGVVIQPEGILISHNELDGPSGVGNPLNACLRTIREFYARHTQDDQQSPYPLLIVRSEGVTAFGKARRAMADWKDEYGFELVSDDLPLAFPNPQPVLSGELKKTIALANDRQRALAMAMPSRYGGQHGVRRQEPVDTDFNTTTQQGDGFGDGQQASANLGSQPGTGGAGDADKTVVDDKSNLNRSSNGGAGNQRTGSGGSKGEMIAPPDGIGMAGRSQGWALADRQRGPALTRPVKVICESNRLTIVPAAGERGKPVVVELGSTVKGSIDQFVTAVNQHIDQWGIAIAGGHWKPELQVDVQPGGELRFKELQYTLYGSGINVWQHTD